MKLKRMRFNLRFPIQGGAIVSSLSIPSKSFGIVLRNV